MQIRHFPRLSVAECSDRHRAPTLENSFLFPTQYNERWYRVCKGGRVFKQVIYLACAASQARSQDMNERENTWKLLKDLGSLPCLWAAQSTEYQYRSNEVLARGTLANKHSVGMVEVEKKITDVENALFAGNVGNCRLPATHLLHTRHFELADQWDMWKRKCLPAVWKHCRQTAIIVYQQCLWVCTIPSSPCYIIWLLYTPAATSHPRIALMCGEKSAEFNSSVSPVADCFA